MPRCQGGFATRYIIGKDISAPGFRQGQTTGAKMTSASRCWKQDDRYGRAGGAVMQAKASESSISKLTIAGLMAFGGIVGPLVDAVHNQALLEYDVLPVTIGAFNARTSALIPPLLSVAYLLLGCVLPRLSEQLFGDDRVANSPDMSPQTRAILAVTSTIAIIKLSEVWTVEGLPASSILAKLVEACFVQWAFLDGRRASFALALIAGFGGPLAELPFLAGGCWHYTSPDYWPLQTFDVSLGPDSWAGLSSVTGPCYFAVTTDAIAIGRWLNSLAPTENDRTSIS